MRIGFGYDVHQLVENRKLFLCGLEIPHRKGLLGHSDADVAIHAIMDSILGALALGDIGKIFPDTDMKYKDIDSKILLEEVCEIMHKEGYEISNLDLTISAQEPKLAGYIIDMRKLVANLLKTDVKNISVKATTTENLGFVGRKEGISTYCVCLLKNKKDEEC